MCTHALTVKMYSQAIEKLGHQKTSNHIFSDGFTIETFSIVVLAYVHATSHDAQSRLTDA